jgi:hypothetical protein
MSAVRTPSSRLAWLHQHSRSRSTNVSSDAAREEPKLENSPYCVSEDQTWVDQAEVQAAVRVVLEGDAI